MEEDRDSKGRFVNGHKPLVDRTGIPNPNAGRKKCLSTELEEAIAAHDKDLPALFKVLVEKGLEGSIEHIREFLNRRLGKVIVPMQIDGEMTHTIIPPDVYAQALKIAGKELSIYQEDKK